MYELQYSHPINGKCITRYFKKLENVYKHIEHFHSPLSYYVSDLDLRDYNYFGYYDPVSNVYIEDIE